MGQMIFNANQWESHITENENRRKHAKNLTIVKRADFERLVQDHARTEARIQHIQSRQAKEDYWLGPVTWYR